MTNLAYVSDNPSPDELDKHMEQMLGALSTALETAGTKTTNRGRSAPWWSEKCQEALLDFRKAKRNMEPGGDWFNLKERKNFLSTVRSEKRNYWRKRIDDIETKVPTLPSSLPPSSSLIPAGVGVFVPATIMAPQLHAGQHILIKTLLTEGSETQLIASKASCTLRAVQRMGKNILDIRAELMGVNECDRFY